ncbi:PREDICTED: uncharacterized protein K02A2.6-like [Thamnophis sirtalis]|uniref:Gypsy retrotransposon integrase-like protein 1 n=1 Tax=Thamnophis sirtalis TaxID=35019 RepID=A0A6I9XKD0_9SAUR|nr:PREDICTED: uncharacterized protein K02A2.6-like [Thamnophis sirtalis]
MVCLVLNAQARTHHTCQNQFMMSTEAPLWSQRATIEAVAEKKQVMIDENLVEQFVCGVKDIHLRRRLLWHPDITMQQAVDEARAAELSEQSTADIQRMQPLPPSPPALPVCPPPAMQACLIDELVLLEDPSSEQVVQLRAQPRRPPPPPAAPATSGCVGCGSCHARTACPFKGMVCHRCGKKDHIAQVCRASLPAPSFLQKHAAPQTQPCHQPPRPARRAEDCYAVNQPDVAGETLSQASAGAQKVSAVLHLEGQPCRMEVDSGSFRSLLSWATFSRLCPHISCDQLQPVDTSLRDYQGTLIPTLGSFPIWVDYGDFHGRLPVLIVKNSQPALLGLDWFPSLGLSIGGLHRVAAYSLEDVLTEFADIFDGQLGSYKGTPISLNLDPQVAPIQLKARRVPFALRAKVDAELDKLLAQGVLEPVDHSRWETPIVVPVKPDGSVQICADSKSTINFALQANPYPVPVVQHLLHSLEQGCTFAKLDMAQSYQQLPVDGNVAAAQTIVTHRGAFRCRRLQFGISLAPGIFQSLMERLLHGLPGMVPYFDEVLIAASSHSKLIEMLRKVLLRFRGVGLKLKRRKCSFAVPRVEFLGFLIDTQGIHPTPAKVCSWVLRGWPLGKVADSFRPFKARQAELSLHGGCLIWGNWVVIPSTLRAQVLPLLHKDHAGIAQMKVLARSYVWWCLLDSEIAAYVGRCTTCQLSRPNPPAGPSREWEGPRGLWSRLHVDFAGPFHGQTFLIVVDAYSRWVELVLMSSTSAESMVRDLRRLFATHGLPDIIVSDNGPQFTSTTFQEILACQGIQHVPTAPYHPA